LFTTSTTRIVVISLLVNRWLSMRFNLLSSAVVGVTGLVVLVTDRVDASLAGFALAFASNITGDVRLNDG
jgi:hypothetical protein